MIIIFAALTKPGVSKWETLPARSVVRGAVLLEAACTSALNVARCVVHPVMEEATLVLHAVARWSRFLIEHIALGGLCLVNAASDPKDAVFKAFGVE